MRLSAERATAVEQATQLREQAARHAAVADAASETAEETNNSITLLEDLATEASATAATQRDALAQARAEDARVVAVKAHLEEEAEAVRQAIIVGQQKSDEANAAHATVQQDLQILLAQRDANDEACSDAKAGAVQSEAYARHADATAAECDQLLEEVRERLAELGA